MSRVGSRAAVLAGLTMLAITLAGCTQGGGAKIDITQVADNQVALDVEGMV